MQNNEKMMNSCFLISLIFMIRTLCDNINFHFQIKKHQSIMSENEDPSLIRILKGHKESIMAMDLHPKCRYVASAGLDVNFLVWDMKTFQSRRFEGHKVTYFLSFLEHSSRH